MGELGKGPPGRKEGVSKVTGWERGDRRASWESLTPPGSLPRPGAPAGQGPAVSLSPAAAPALARSRMDRVGSSYYFDGFRSRALIAVTGMKAEASTRSVPTMHQKPARHNLGNPGDYLAMVTVGN